MPDLVLPQRLKLWLVLSALGALGVGLLIFPSAAALPRFWHDLALAIGTALLVAALLGASVDQWLKQRLAREAFNAVFGYMLPAELKDELMWIYEQELVCESFALRLTLKRTDDADLVIVHSEWEREFRNVTTHKVKAPLVVAVDEWFHQGRPSRVISVRCTKNGETHSQTKAMPSSDCIVARELTTEISIKPKACATVIAEAEETKHVSDAWFLNLIYAAANPRVTVDAPEGIVYSVMYGFNRHAGSVQQKGRQTWELPGTLLPGQVIQVRWWQVETESVSEGRSQEPAA